MREHLRKNWLDKSHKGIIYSTDVLSRYPAGIKRCLCRGFLIARQRMRFVCVNSCEEYTSFRVCMRERERENRREIRPFDKLRYEKFTVNSSQSSSYVSCPRSRLSVDVLGVFDSLSARRSLNA